MTKVLKHTMSIKTKATIIHPIPLLMNNISLDSFSWMLLGSTLFGIADAVFSGVFKVNLCSMCIYQELATIWE